MLEARAICRTSPEGRSLLRNVNLRVDGGERVALSGPTGSGKTVLLRALALLDPVDSGEVTWRGTPVPGRSVPQFRADVIYIQQRPTLVEGTVEENLRMAFGFKVHQHRRFERGRMLQTLAVMERDEPFLRQDVSHLSGGERQIVAVLRALATAPSFLLLDEPTAALDERSVKQIESTILHWLDESSARACVWVTHDAQQAMRVANRHVQMQAGTLTESGSQAGTS